MEKRWNHLDRYRMTRAFFSLWRRKRPINLLLSLYLTDTLKGTKVDMRSVMSYTYTTGSTGQRNFTIAVEGTHTFDVRARDSAEKEHDVTFSGSLWDDGSAVEAPTYTLADEYGEYNYSGSVDMTHQ